MCFYTNKHRFYVLIKNFLKTQESIKLHRLLIDFIKLFDNFAADFIQK